MLRRVATSLTLKLAALVALFVALPIVLYGQFEEADRQMRHLFTRAIQDRSALIAEAIAPVLRDTDPAAPNSLNAELARHASSGSALKLMYQPPADRTAGRFYLVAAAPPLPGDAVASELEELGRRGILKRLSEACIWNTANEIRYRREDGTAELLTSIIPIQARGSCWVLTTTHVASEFLDTAIGRPYWETREVRIAAAIYLVGAGLALLIALGIRMSLRRFRTVADEIAQGRLGDEAFSRRNTVPELASVARDFDRLVVELRRVSREIRQSAEDNAHSFKTPLAAVQSALRPVRRAVPPEDERARRALEIVDSSLARLLALVNAAQRHDLGAADLIDAPRLVTEVAPLVEEAARHFREILSARAIHLSSRLERGISVRAGKGMLEVVLQSILENAISLAPSGSTIAIHLGARGSSMELRVDDEGPGVDETHLERIFERYVSVRPQDDSRDGDIAGHSGLGLWIARRNIGALGGRVAAANRPAGGLSITITLPLAAME